MKLHYISLLYYSSSSTETVTVLMHHRVSEEHMTTCAFMFKASAQLPLKSWRGLHAWWVLIPSFPSAIRSLSTPVIAPPLFCQSSTLGSHDLQRWMGRVPARVPRSGCACGPEWCRQTTEVYILCWRQLSRHRLLPAVSPAAGHLTINQFIWQQRAKGHLQVAKIQYTIITVQDNVYNI